MKRIVIKFVMDCVVPLLGLAVFIVSLALLKHVFGQAIESWAGLFVSLAQLVIGCIGVAVGGTVAILSSACDLT